MKFGGGGFKAPHIGAVHPKVGMPSSPKVHPAAQIKTRMRLPDSGSVGADTSPIVPNAGRI